MKTCLWFVISVALGLLFLQTVDGQGIHVPEIKNGFFTEKIGNLTVEGNYLDGKKEGNWLTYYPSGYLNKVEEYHDGMKNGLVLEIDGKGGVTSETHYKNDMLDGVSKGYVRSGKFE
ncbi:MAG: hypothetical protein HGA23_10625 [Bacteroidales bacterium]|nr:hypothetical protein [Bacteroidales bacterium]